MAINKQTKYQESDIRQYYDNIETIMLQKLDELVTELYLAETKKKQDNLWQRVHKAMIKLKIAPAIIEHIMQKRNVEILAKNLQDWLQRTKRR